MRTIAARSDKARNLRPGPSARRDHVRQVAAGTVSLGALLLLLVLFDRTGGGIHAAWCGRGHLGEVVGKLAGRARAYSVRHMSRYLAELTAAGWITTVYRWEFDENGNIVGCTALRSLSDKLLGAVDRLAGLRWRKRAKTDATPQPRPAGADDAVLWELDEHGNAVRVERGPPAS